MTDRTASVPAFTPTQRTLAAIILSLSNFVVVLDMTVANVSVPHIAGSLGVSLDQGTWVITSYAVAEAITVPLTGWLALRFGTVRTFIACMAGFGLFSLLCGLSLTLEMIVICRIGQGLCGGLLMPLAQTLLFQVFPGAQRARAIFLSAMTTLLAPALGPNLGGFLSDNMSWHWIFLINIPIVIVCAFSVATLLGKHETERQKLPIDRVGLGLLILWICCMQLVLDLGRDRDWFADPMILTFGIIAAIGFIVFLIWELTEEHPIVDLRVFRHPSFTWGLVALSLCFGAYFATIVVIPQWLQTYMGYPAMLAGFVTSCTAIAAMTTSRLAAKVMARGVDIRLLVSCAIMWLGCMALVRSQWTSGADFWQLSMPQLFQGFGMAFFMLPLTTLALGAIPAKELASATGMLNFVRTVSVAVSTAVALTLWGDTQQEARSELVSRLQPDDAVRTLDGAGMSAAQVRGVIASIVDKEATTIAVDYVFLLSAVAFFIGALAIWLVPRQKVASAGRAPN